jgi:hypothetical protein
MPEIPQNTLGPTDLNDWYVMQKQMAKLRVSEMFLRKKIFAALFPDPHEGTNSFDLGDGYVVKGVYSITRDVDAGTLQNCADLLRQNGIRVDDLVNYKPSLAKANYNRLTEEQKQMFDQVLIVKPGSPSLEIVKPKKVAKA